MGRALPPVAELRTSGIPEPAAPSCPGCGTGDLFLIEVTRGGGEIRRVAYCAGVYDRDRRRFLRRSCGYSGPADGDSGSGTAVERGSVPGPRPPDC